MSNKWSTFICQRGPGQAVCRCLAQCGFDLVIDFSQLDFMRQVVDNDKHLGAFWVKLIQMLFLICYLLL